jgi:hypothetical protein
MEIVAKCHVCFRNMGPEGWKVRQQHFETATSLVRASRNFFLEGAAAEIWSEFRFDSFHFVAFSMNVYLLLAHPYFLFATLLVSFFNFLSMVHCLYTCVCVYLKRITAE